MTSAGCRLNTCDISTSPYGYRPNLAANAVLLAVLALGLIGGIVITMRRRRFFAFTALLTAAYSLYIASHAERINGWKDPWSEGPFKASLALATMGPALATIG
jgi:hypothetical protein